MFWSFENLLVVGKFPACDSALLLDGGLSLIIFVFPFIEQRIALANHSYSFLGRFFKDFFNIDRGLDALANFIRNGF